MFSAFSAFRRLPARFQFVELLTSAVKTSGGDVLAVPPYYLIAFGECGECVRYRHFARLVALKPHLFENLAPGKAVSRSDDAKQLFALAAFAALRRSACRCFRGELFTSLGGFIGINRREFPVDVSQLGFKFLLLSENCVALAVQAFTLPRYKFRHRLGHSYPPDLRCVLVAIFPPTAKRPSRAPGM